MGCRKQQDIKISTVVSCKLFLIPEKFTTLTLNKMNAAQNEIMQSRGLQSASHQYISVCSQFPLPYRKDTNLWGDSTEVNKEWRSVHA
jgi:hypothetical protein